MGADTPPAGPEAVQDIVVGALLPRSGEYAGGGEASRVALEVAAGDINDYFASIGSDRRVGIIIEDTKADPATALAKLQALEGQDVRIVIGPGTSAELEAVRTYADEHGFILISTMSTAPSLAIAGDNVYRLVPPDTYQADVMAYYLREQGVTAIVPVWRGDVWGDELEKLTAAALVRGGGKVLDGVRYTPDQVYGAIAADLDARVARAIAAHGREKVAVYLVSLDEADRIMGAAMATENLPKVRWYGCDGSVLLDSLASGEPARFAEQTKFTCPALWNQEGVASNTATIQKMRELLGRHPDGYGLATYDALWIVAMARTEADTADVAMLKTALERTAEESGGPLFGPAHLNGAGDLSSAHYTFWTVSADGAACRWVPVVQYGIASAGATPELEWVGA
ncbi:branched-chain amino acid ABC transporter substrate-binding protein [Methanoculleus chikugoensis]|uniref:Branched-chain amino acid ABC transporter substrate-binding protein n=2 Tax=Methanoculleus chikugoensis TaxID=118126 RepID=A0ABN5XK39_9EURY|nr:branched-chain amino acid ABC transporter substrate-binding protein [Methanoculleus chikugoensis]